MRLIPGVMVAVLFTAVRALAADAPPANPAQPCVDVQIGNDRTAYLNCLNDAMQRRVEHERGAPQVTAPIDARSSSNQVGTFNDAAAREKMGNAYGVSPVPQRLTPSTPVPPPAGR